MVTLAPFVTAGELVEVWSVTMTFGLCPPPRSVPPLFSVSCMPVSPKLRSPVGGVGTSI